MAAFPDWETQLLQAIGAPVTAANMLFLSAWQDAEGGSAQNNPLNTTQQAPGATSYNYNGGNPVKNYPSPLTGLTATVQTLLNGNYPNILNALKSGDPISGSYNLGEDLQTWGTGSGFFQNLLQSGKQGLSNMFPGAGALLSGVQTGQAITGSASDTLNNTVSQTVSTLLVMAGAAVLLLVGGIWLANSTGAGTVIMDTAKKGAELAA